MRNLITAFVFIVSALAPSVHAADTTQVTTAEEVRPIVDLGVLGAERLALPSAGDQVVVTRSTVSAGLDVTIAPGDIIYPGVTFSFATDTMDLSDAGYLELRLTNTCERILSISLRVDSIPSGDIPRGRGTGSAYLKPGDSGVARVYFNQATKNYAAVNPRLIKQILIYTAKETVHERSFRIDSIVAGGRSERPLSSL